LVPRAAALDTAWREKPKGKDVYILSDVPGEGEDLLAMPSI